MAELQERFQARYKGRKGRKRLQEIYASIDEMHRDMGNRYDQYEEMAALEALLPDPEVRLYFMKYLRDLDAMWSGVQTYGLLRLCGKWVRQKQIEELTQPEVDAMLEGLLPSKEWKLLTEGPAEGGPGKAAVNAAEGA